MSLAARDFEKRWRKLYRAELKDSPQLRAQVKQQRKKNDKASAYLIRRVLLPLFWCSVFLSVVGKETALAIPAAAIALWAAGAAFRWGHYWFQQFYASEDLIVLNVLPLNDAQIFRFQLRRYMGAAGWLFWEMFLAYGVLALLEQGAVPPWYQLLLAALFQAVLVIALALHLASWLHMLPLGSIGGLLRLTAVVLVIFGSQRADFASYLTQATEWFLPTGWVNYAVLRGPADPAVYALLLPLAALIYLARYSFARLRGYYSLAGVEIMPARSAGTPDHEELTGENAGPRPGPTEIEDRVLARSFLQGLNWELAGALERFAARAFSHRERIVTEFLVAGNPGWTQSWKVSFWIWLATCTVVVTLGQFGGTIVFFAAYVLATTSLPLFGGEWRGMRQTATGGVFLPAFSVYPIRFNTIALIFLKVNLIRIAAASPLIMSFAALAAFQLDQSPLSGALTAAKLLAVLVCVQPLFIIFPISSTTNDSSRGRVLARLAVLIPLLVLIVGAGLAVFFTHSPGPLFLSYLLLILVSSLAFVAYRRAYRRGKFDLLTERAPYRG